MNLLKKIAYKKIAYYIFAILLIAAVRFVSQDIYGVIISGNIIFKEHKNEPIYVSASSEKAISFLDPADLAIIKISRPGQYYLKVPKNCGKVFLRASSGHPNYRWNLYSFIPFGTFAQNPLDVRTANIEGADIVIASPDKKVMDDYKGKTVLISGKVIFDGYKKGKIQIMIWSKNSKWGPPDIAETVIPSPGFYSLRVPEGMGEIYIQARNFISEKDDSISRFNYFWPYRGKIDIASSDIENIDIVIPNRRVLF